MAGPGLHQVQRMSLQQILAPQLQQSLHLLQVPTLELRSLVQEELQQNPLLEEIPKDEPTVEIESPEGEVLGTHQGLAFYTLGQREGLHIGGRRGRLDQPWYLAAKDGTRNALIVVQGHDHPLLRSSSITTGPMHWLVDARSAPFRCTVKVRYRQVDQPAILEPRSDGTARIQFDDPQRAVTPGQYAVAYENDRCLGGAVIESVNSASQQQAAA